MGINHQSKLAVVLLQVARVAGVPRGEAHSRIGADSRMICGRVAITMLLKFAIFSAMVSGNVGQQSLFCAHGRHGQNRDENGG